MDAYKSPSDQFDETTGLVADYLSSGTLEEQYIKSLKLAGCTPSEVSEDQVYQWALASGIVYGALFPVLHPVDPTPQSKHRRIDDIWEPSDWGHNA